MVISGAASQMVWIPVVFSGRLSKYVAYTPSRDLRSPPEWFSSGPFRSLQVL